MRNKKIYLIVYMMASIGLCVNLLADGLFQISIAGYWSDRVLFWIWLGITLPMIIIFWKKLLTKIYFGALVVGLILSILPMMVPFFAILLSATGQGLLFKKQLNPQYRLQIINYGIMGRPIMEIVANKGLLEQRIAKFSGNVKLNDSVGFEIWEIRDVKLNNEDEQKISIVSYNEKSQGIIDLKKN